MMTPQPQPRTRFAPSFDIVVFCSDDLTEWDIWEAPNYEELNDEIDLRAVERLLKAKRQNEKGVKT